MKKRAKKAYLKANEVSVISEEIPSSAIGSISNGKNLIVFYGFSKRVVEHNLAKFFHQVMHTTSHSRRHKTCYINFLL